MPALKSKCRTDGIRIGGRRAMPGALPPEFDWQGSENLDSAHVLYPAPHRLRTKAGDVVGYTDRVMFPVSVTPKDAAKPISLHGKVDYGVCKDICVPAEVESSDRRFRPACRRVEGADRTSLRGFRSSEARLGIDPSLAAWHLDQSTGKPKLVLNIATTSPDQCRCIRRCARRHLRSAAEARCRRLPERPCSRSI